LQYAVYDIPQLLDNTFKAQMIDSIQELIKAHPDSPVRTADDVYATLDRIRKVLDVVTPLGGPVAPIVASIGLGVASIRLLGTYASTPETIRAFMGYIVDLTLTLESLFWITSAQPEPRDITADDIEAAYGHYIDSGRRRDVHSEIRLFVKGLNLEDVIKNRDDPRIKLERLIETYRHDISQGNYLKNSPVARQLLTANASGSHSTTHGGGDAVAIPHDAIPQQPPVPTKQKIKGVKLFENLKKSFGIGNKNEV